MIQRLIAACLLTPIGFAGSAIAQSQMRCEPTAEAYAYSIMGKDTAGRLTDQRFPEVYGENSFYQRLENGWVFSLRNTENGWSIRLFDGEPVGDATDLTSLTPPHGGAPNPRDIDGWHFRNAANTGPNTGDVNAPQEMRAFFISPALQGTGGYRPSVDPDTPRHTGPGPDDGIGWLRVIEYGLSGNSLNPGHSASMNYLRFEACVSWPRSDDETAAWKDARSFDYIPEENEIFGACGVDLQKIALDARFLPRTLGGDIDGDDAGDQVVQVKRIADGRRGIALCRAGTWATVIGLDDKRLEADLPAGKIAQIESWHWIKSGDELPPGIGQIELPAADGDILILERIEREAIAIYWNSGELTIAELYHLVEP